MKSSELLTLNDNEIKRIMSVIERDFKLRQNESKRIEELKKVIQQEYQRIEHLSNSKEFNSERCIRCYKPFKILFNPKDICSQCKLYVCHNCSIYNKQIKTWTCKICLKLKELKSLTSDWFYIQSGQKYKRCGSAKIVRELHKRENELAEIDEDLGYGTLTNGVNTDSKDSSSFISYIVHDKNIKNELNEYSKRLIILIDNLQSNLLERNKHHEDYQQQITLEINRTRIALSGPLRRKGSNMRSNLSYENDLQNLLIQKTSEVLQINLQQIQKNLIVSNSSKNFDQKLAKIIYDKCIKKDIPQNLSQIIDSVPERQSSPTSSPIKPSNSSREIKSLDDPLRKMALLRTLAVDEEDTEKEEEEENKTPTEHSIEDYHRFSDTIKKSNERIDDWKTNFTLIESKIIPLDNDEQDVYSTWL